MATNHEHHAKTDVYTTMNRQLSHPHRVSGNRLLARILDEPNLPTMVQRLPSSALSALINRIGLEDSGSIVALATTEQLTEVFDTDLWKNERPGQAEQFDPERFLVWLDVLMESGASFAAERVTALPEDLVTLAFHRRLLVLDIGALGREAHDYDFEPHDDMLTGRLHEELDNHQLLAREEEGWDTLLALIMAMEREQPEFLQRILDRCAAMTREFIDDNGGLYEVLSSEEMLAADVAAERDDRRAEMGYIAPTAAAAFLKSAKAAGDPYERDPTTRAYFRTLSKSEPPPSSETLAPVSPGIPPEPNTLLPLLLEAGVIDDMKSPLLLNAGPANQAEEPVAPPPLFLRALHALGESEPYLFEKRHEELAYLANVLVAGASVQTRRLRPAEALRGAIATCNLGLEHILAQGGPSRQKLDMDKRGFSVLQRTSADVLFRAGWRELHQGALEPATKTALRLLQGKPLSRLRLLSRELDPMDFKALRALLDDCPTLAGTLGQGREDGAQPTEVAGEKAEEPLHFITTQTDFTALRRFLDGLKLFEL